jgi:hypothetical protein
MKITFLSGLNNDIKTSKIFLYESSYRYNSYKRNQSRRHLTE